MTNTKSKGMSLVHRLLLTLALALGFTAFALRARAQIECVPGVEIWWNAYYGFICIPDSFPNDCTVCIDYVDGVPPRHVENKSP